MKHVLIAAVILMLIPPTWAITYTFTDYTIAIRIENDGKIREEVSFTIYNTGQEPISWVEYSLISAPEDLRVEDGDGPLDYSLENQRNILINLRNPLREGESRRLSLHFTISGVVAKVDDNQIITLNYMPVVDISGFTLLITLPPASTLASEIKKTGESIPSVYPTPSRIYTDGKRIIVEWNREKLRAHESFRIFIMYTGTEDARSKYIFAGVLGGLIGFAGAYYLFVQRRGKKIARMVLGRDEQVIYDILLGSGGEVTQDNLAKKTGFSKAKVSKLVRRLEERGIISKAPHGKTNKLILRKEFGGRD
jgi:hypothetical protein